jgi:hypothetical protein
MGTEREPPVGMATETSAPAHEGADVNVRAIVIATTGLALVTLGVLAVLWLQLQALWAARRASLPPPSPVAAVLPSAPPEPRLQTSPGEELRALRATEDARLHGYGWVDRRAGVVRIPIERAMELVAQERGR